jgi:hypothetical protein
MNEEKREKIYDNNSQFTIHNAQFTARLEETLDTLKMYNG